jgi:hypothetical protein
MGSSLTPKGGSPSGWKHLLIRVDAALMSLRVRGDRSHARGGGRQQDRDGFRVPRDDHRAFRPDLIYIGAQLRFDICKWGNLHFNQIQINVSNAKLRERFRRRGRPLHAA